MRKTELNIAFSNGVGWRRGKTRTLPGTHWVAAGEQNDKPTKKHNNENN